MSGIFDRLYSGFKKANNSFGELLWGSPDKVTQHSTLDPNQQKLFAQLINSLQGGQMNVSQNPLYNQGANYLSQLLSGDSQAFADFENPYKRQFSEEVIPQIADRFAGAGLGSSSGLNQTLARAGSDLTGTLAALRAQLQQTGLNQALDYSRLPSDQNRDFAGMLMGIKPFENYAHPATTGLIPGFLSGGLSGFADAFGKWGMGKLSGNTGNTWRR